MRGTAARLLFPPRSRARIRQLARYASVSAISTLVSLTVLGVLVDSRIATPGWANLIATAIGTVPSFELNRRWVWGRRDRRSLRHQVLPFAAISFAGLVISTAAVAATGHVVSSAAPAVRTGLIEAANLASFGVLWVGQFLILDRLLFGTGPGAKRGAESAETASTSSWLRASQQARPACKFTTSSRRRSGSRTGGSRCSD